ncbi:MAG: hypothetical protein ACOYXW_01195 [Actinomycetota bacterium]
MTGRPGDYRLLFREHVYDTCWALDLTRAEVAGRLATSEVGGAARA